MPSSKSVLFLLASIECKKQKQHIQEKIINVNSGNKRNKWIRNKEKKEFAHFLGRDPRVGAGIISLR